MDYEQLVEMVTATMMERRREDKLAQFRRRYPEQFQRSSYTEEIWRRAVERTPRWNHLTPAQKEEFCEEITPIIALLEEAGVLLNEPARHYRVIIDDPDMRHAYVFESVPAFSAMQAAIEGARMACAKDPGHGLSSWPVEQAFDAIAIENQGLIESVSMYATVERLPSVRQEVLFESGRE